MTGAVLKGYDACQKKLKRLARKDANAAMRKAFRAGAQVMRTAVKKATPADEGVLRRTQDLKVTRRGNRLGAFIGSNVEKLEAAHKADPARPTNLDWLVEFGHVTPGGVFVRPSGHMRRAADEAMPRSEAKVVEVLAREIEKAAVR